MKNKLLSLKKDLEDLKNTNLLEEKCDNLLSVVNKLKEARNCIITSGFFDIEEDYIFNTGDKLARDINYSEDFVSGLVTLFNNSRAHIFTSIIKLIKESKRIRDSHKRKYYIDVINNIPGKINHKYSKIFFRYFNDTYHKELFEEIIPELVNLEKDRGIRDRLLFLYSHKILAGYLFINFSKFTNNINKYSTILSRSMVSSSESINMKKMKSIVSYTHNTNRIIAERDIEHYVLEMSNVVRSMSDKDLRNLIYQYGKCTYLKKIISVFISKRFSDFASSYHNSFCKIEAIEKYYHFDINKIFKKIFNIIENEG